MAHSLAADDGYLERLAGGEMKIVPDGEGTHTITHLCPDEEALESLAARTRPFILKQDPVHYDRVLTALSTFASRHGHSRDVEHCRRLRADWRWVDLGSGAPATLSSKSSPDPGAVLGPSAAHDDVVTAAMTGVRVAQITDLGLAVSWLYGDLIHADEERIAAGAPFDITARFQAASVRVAQVAVMVRDTLSFIRALVQDGVIPWDWSEVEAQPVAAEPRPMLHAILRTAPTSTPLPQPGVALSEEWTSLAVSETAITVTCHWGADQPAAP